MSGGYSGVPLCIKSACGHTVHVGTPVHMGNGSGHSCAV